MSFLLPAGGATVTAPYVSPYSGDFEVSEGDVMTWTPGATQSNNKIATLSFWDKRESIGGVTGLGNDLYMADAGQFVWTYTVQDVISGYINGGTSRLLGNPTYTDTTNWHHWCFRIDTTNSTAGDRLRLYYDGTEVTSFSTEPAPALNATFAGLLVSGDPQYIGGGAKYDGKMAECAVCDGQSYGPESFRDASTSLPLNLSDLTFGTNGFWLDFTILGTDISGRGNNWTNSGVAQSSDTPSNPA